MALAPVIAALAEELSLFAGVGFVLFAIDDLLVDLIYLSRRIWRGLAIYSRYPRAFASTLPPPSSAGWIAVFIPAWDESAVIAPMLRETLARFGASDYRLFVGHYPNDPATALQIASVSDPLIVPVSVPHPGPTTKADCLNHLYGALVEAEREVGNALAVVLHDAEDVVHPCELRVFASLIHRAAAIQLPVIPLSDPTSPWIAGHYGDEFAESHGKELVVREAVGASIPLAGVACAIERGALARLAAGHSGRPFAAESMTEDYEIGLRLGALGLKTMFVRIPAAPGELAVVASRSHFPTRLDDAVRQKARWIGGIAFAGWDRLGWSGGLGERWMRMRDRRGPLAALLMLAGYGAALLWGQLALAQALGAPVDANFGPRLLLLLRINFALLLWRMVMRAGFTAATYGLWQGILSVPRLVIANLIGILAVRRAIDLHDPSRAPKWDKTRHIFPQELGT